ncbi:hypothetical protein K466DRAFT_10703 [Polyporus arcularius HHB13444]|uniref:CFEM domain-containing protein n=1 Tax=Polyporus arcularius HHB13444 TaxID=1314778 RepID=A0A5C3NS81_9APHY|nr:hypothetical protein K466DRAFT_10703 [Polyporus arcularius HHB13444]
MHASILLFAALSAAVPAVDAQGDGCAETCVQELVAGCDTITDPNCVCGGGSTVDACIQSNCSSTEQQLFSSISSSICAAAITHSPCSVHAASQAASLTIPTSVSLTLPPVSLSFTTVPTASLPSVSVPSVSSLPSRSLSGTSLTTIVTSALSSTMPSLSSGLSQSSSGTSGTSSGTGSGTSTSTSTSASGSQTSNAARAGREDVAVGRAGAVGVGVAFVGLL